jgi:membrane protein DedA with SNARE-associated domain
MEDPLRILEIYGYWAIFLAVILDFLGVPITTIPLLVISGAMAAAGKMSLPLVVLLATIAAAVGDTFLYGLGRIKGQTVLEAMCGLFHNKPQCVLRSTRFATKYSVASLLVSKFVPGIATFAPPAAGTAGVPLLKFLLLDATGCLVWATVFSGAGYILSEQTHALLRTIGQMGYWTLIVLLVLTATAFFLYSQKEKFLFEKEQDKQ